MLRLFQSTNPFTFLLLVVYTGIVFAHDLMFPGTYTAPVHSIISNGLLSDILHVEQWPLRAVELLKLVFILTTGMLLSFMMQKFKLINKTTLMPAAVFVLICSYFPELQQQIPVLLSGLLLCVMLYRIFAVYNKQHADMAYFDTALFGAAATLIYTPAIYFFLFGILGLLRMRSTSFRDFIIYVTGWFTVAFLIGTLIFWNGTWETWQASLKEHMQYWQHQEMLFTTNMLIKLGLIGVVFIVAAIFYFDKLSANLIQIRKYMGVFIVLLLHALIGAGIGPGLNQGSLYMLWIPVTVVISYYFFHYKQVWYSEGMHAALFVGTILFQYLTFAS